MKQKDDKRFQTHVGGEPRVLQIASVIIVLALAIGWCWLAFKSHK